MRIKDILVHAQRVNKTWHAVIQNSPKLQQALFFQAVPTQIVQNFDTTSLGSRSERNANSKSAPLTQHTHDSTVDNPFVAQLEYDSIMADLIGGKDMRAHERHDASWRRMFFSQPPTELQRCLKLGDLCGDSEKLIVFERWLMFGRDEKAGWLGVEYASEVHDNLR